MAEDLDPYAVLGVGPDASGAELRRAYLAQARRHHPDARTADGPDRPAGSGAEAMARINAAWEVLGDPDRRAEHDRRRRRDQQRRQQDGAPSVDWVPFDPGDDPDDPAAEHDVPYGDGSVPARSLQVGPAAVFVVGVFALSAGAVMSFAPLLVLGLVSIVTSLVLFVGTPLWVVLRSHRQTHERHR